MAYYFSKRKLRPKEDDDVGELNIVPYLDILMNLIIFMLLSMTGLVAFGVVNVAAPDYGSVQGQTPQEGEATPLTLTVSVSKLGFFVAATGAVLPGQAEAPANSAVAAPTLPLKADQSYDMLGLTEKMKEIKQAFPNETKVYLTADRDIPYETLIATMDAIRETSDRKPLFHDVVLAEFAKGTEQ